MGTTMKNYLNDKDLAKMGITQGCIDALQRVGALPDLIDTTDGKAIPLAEFGALFEHLAMSFCMIRQGMLAKDRANVGTAGVDFAPAKEPEDYQDKLDTAKDAARGVDSEIIAGRHNCKLFGPVVATEQTGGDTGCAGCIYHEATSSDGAVTVDATGSCPRMENGRLACGEIDKVWVKANLDAEIDAILEEVRA